MTVYGHRLVRLLEGLDFLISEFQLDTIYVTYSDHLSEILNDDRGSLIMSSRLARLVEPTIGAETPDFESTQAIATCAMLIPLFFAISSTLRVRKSAWVAACPE